MLELFSLKSLSSLKALNDSSHWIHSDLHKQTFTPNCKYTQANINHYNYNYYFHFIISLIV